MPTIILTCANCGRQHTVKASTKYFPCRGCGKRVKNTHNELKKDTVNPQVTNQSDAQQRDRVNPPTERNYSLQSVHRTLDNPPLLKRITVNCHSCGKGYNVLVDNRMCFYCSNCRVNVRFTPDGKSIVPKEINPAATTSVHPIPKSINQNGHSTTYRKAPENASKSNDDYVGHIAYGFAIVIVLGVICLIGAAISSWNDSHAKRQASIENHTTYAQPSQSPIPQSVTPTNVITPNNLTSDAGGQLCNVRIINTLVGTDKTGVHRASLDEQTKTLTLTYVGNPNDIISIHNESGEVNVISLYQSGRLQAIDTLYRRVDIETSNKEIVYTNRQQNLKIILTYD